jgi:hypothetical protein
MSVTRVTGLQPAPVLDEFDQDSARILDEEVPHAGSALVAIQLAPLPLVRLMWP